MEARREDGTLLKIDADSESRHLTIPSGNKVTLTETYQSPGAAAYTTNSKIQVHLEKDAQLTHYKVVQEGPQATHHSFMEVHVGPAASFQSHVFLLDGARVRNTLHVRLEEEGAECSLNGLYLATREEVMETHTLIDHMKPHGTSREFYKGILDEKAQGLFDGLVIVEKDAQKTDSTQSNKNLLLSSTARANSNPELKILANDVKCKHGATIGQLDAGQLFYLQSRGIPAEEARKLLIFAFASEMLIGVTQPSLREVLEKALFAKFQK
jgi:Fe-S cluster assembly protein SufD